MNFFCPRVRYRIRPIVAAAASILSLVIQSQSHAFDAGPTRVVGPYTSGQTSPAPGGGWQPSDDRTIGQGVNGQDGWVENTFPTKYDNEISTTVSHSGDQSWRVSNWFHTGLTGAISSPLFPAVGETGTTGSHGQPVTSNNVSFSIWVRSASTSADPGSTVTINLFGTDRRTYLNFNDDGTNLTSTAIQYDGTNEVDAVSSPMTRGAWYKLQVDATFNDGPSNDVVAYNLYSADNLVTPFFTATQDSWEGLGAIGVDHLSWRLATNADNNTQAPLDTFSVTNRPFGYYFDDLSISVGGSQVYATSFEVAPEPTTVGLAVTAIGLSVLAAVEVIERLIRFDPEREETPGRETAGSSFALVAYSVPKLNDDNTPPAIRHAEWEIAKPDARGKASAAVR